jgi:hypothetical protein
VKPEVTSYSHSPLSMALISYSSRTSSANAIDTYRCFLDDDDLVDEFKRSDGYYVVNSRSSFTADEAQWLWQKSSELSVGEDLRSNQRSITRRFWSIIANIDYRLHLELQFPIVQMDKGILNDIQYGRCHILQDLFWICDDVMHCYVLGAWFLHWLTSLHLDPELCVAHELANLNQSTSLLDNKRIVFERDWEQKWILGFEWVFDHKAPGYLLSSEYTVIVVERFLYSGQWPFCERDGKTYRKWGDRSAHFSRRMAAKERKERARLGQKQPRSRMPGTWKW